MDADVRRLRADSQVESNNGIYEYLLGGKYLGWTALKIFERRSEKSCAAASTRSGGSEDSSTIATVGTSQPYFSAGACRGRLRCP